MRPTQQRGVILALGTLLLSACGSGGSDRAPPGSAAPTVTISANPATITTGQSTTLTWSSTNATSCTASGGWSGSRATSGTEQIGSIASTTTFTLACTGAGGSQSQSATVTVTTPGAGNVVVSGKITFDRVPFKAPPLQGLNPAAPVESPARQVVVEAINASTNAVLTSTTTDTNGDYALSVPAGTSIFIRARAQMLKTGAAPTWEFSVRNNTNADALYVLDGSSFDTGAANSTRNLKAAVGWNGTAYTNRSAAPFAILDSVYQGKELILSANASAVLPRLDLFWSTSNRGSDAFCPDAGDIGTSFYIGSGAQDDCASPQPLPAGIYILGEFASGAGDTDEFDQHVVAHEFGHYFEARFSRSDSIGGSHGGEPLDLRVAFGEGWGNAFAGLTLGDPLYRDSTQGVLADGTRFNLESDSAQNEGWFSEFSVGEIIWDIHDAAADAGDAVQLPFARTFEVMTGPQVQTEALTSIFSFARALRESNSASSAAIAGLLNGESISGTDDFGSNESNEGGVGGVTPIYSDTSQIASFCTEGTPNDLNKLGNRKFFRLEVPNGGATVVVQVNGTATTNGQAAVDPDLFIYRRGRIVGFGTSGDPGAETTQPTPLEAGTHVLEIFDFEQRTERRCMTASIQGI